MGKFNLTDALLEEGIRCGDIVEGMDKNKRRVYCLQTQTHTEFKSKSKDQSFVRSVALKADEIQDAMMGFNSWNLTQFQLTRPAVGSGLRALPASSSSSSVQVLLDQRSTGSMCELTSDEWDQAQAILNQGKTEVGKYLQQLKTMLRDPSISSPADHLYGKLTLEFV